MNIEQAISLKSGDRVLINYSNVRFGETIKCAGIIESVSSIIQNALDGSPYVWIGVRYNGIRSVFSSRFISKL